MSKFLIVLSSLLALSQAQIFSFGGCPNVPAVTNFTIDKIKGRWFQQFRYPSALEGTGKCTSFDFNIDANKTITAVNIAHGFTDNKQVKTNGTLSLADQTVADFKFTKKTDTSLIPDNFKIIDTDYTGYFVMYSCQNFFLFHYKYVAIYTRDRIITFLNNAYYPKAIATLDKYSLPKSNTTLLYVDEVLCPLFW